MALNSVDLISRVASHAGTLGVFQTINKHEPKNAPGNGISAAIWVEQIEPVPVGSGLRSTSARVTLNVRVYKGMISEPQDEIDPAMMRAVDLLMAAYSGDFTLGGTVRNVDLLGEFGVPLMARAGYLNQDNKMYRIMTVNLPLILNDVWTQGA